MNITSIFLGVITLAIVIAVIFTIYLMLILRKAIQNLRELMETVENSFKPAVIELQETLRSIKNVTERTVEITEDVGMFSGALKDAGKSIKHVSGTVEHVVSSVEGITSLASLEALSLKAGIMAGLWFLSNNLFKKR